MFFTRFLESIDVRPTPVFLMAAVLFLSGCLESGGYSPWSPKDRQDSPFEGEWPEVDEAEVRPGARLLIDGGGACTANFLFRSPDNATLYLGTAAHCFGDTDAGTGAGVEVPNVGRIGRVAFNGWEHGGASGAPDFGLIELHDTASVRGVTHPAVKHFGGPVALADSGEAITGEKVMGYGNSPQRGNNDPENPREGYVMNNEGDELMVHTVHPGVQGDSGMGLMNGSGEALCVLVTAFNTPLWEVMPQRDSPNVNWCETLDNALEHAAQNDPEFQGLELVTWDLFEDGELPA